VALTKAGGFVWQQMRAVLTKASERLKIKNANRIKEAQKRKKRLL
jgi:hypothetical protein